MQSRCLETCPRPTTRTAVGGRPRRRVHCPRAGWEALFRLSSGSVSLTFPCTFSESWSFCSTFRGFLQLGLVILSLNYF